MENQIDALGSAFHALADPTRLAVVARLASGAAPVKALSEPFDMGLPAFLKHIKVLEESGLIETEKSGRVRTCRLRRERLESAESWLAEQRRLWEARNDRLAAFAEELQSWQKDA